MTVDAVVTLAVLAVAAALFVTERIRPDLVALLVAATLGLSGVLTPAQALGGFGSPTVAVVVAVFVLAEGVRVTGITDRLGAWLLRLAGTGEKRLVAVVMAAGAVMSLFMNNTAAASILLPAVSVAGRRAGVSLSRLLMPLAFSTVLGGMATLLTTTNLLVSGVLRESGHRPFGILDFLPLGLPLVVLGIGYMCLWGAGRLPRTSPADDARAAQADLLQVYRLGERLFWARVAPASPLAGRSLAQCAFREACGASVLAVRRPGTTILSPSPDTEIREGDDLLLEGRREDFDAMADEACLRVVGEGGGEERGLESESVAVVEVVLSPRSRLIGETLATSHFREKYGMTALALWRAEKPTRTGLRDLELRFGDALLLQGPRGRLEVLRAEPDLIVLDAGAALPRTPAREWRAAWILAATVALAAMPGMPTSLVLVAGALVMILSRVLPMDQAYQSVEWRTVFLVAGMLPASTALVQSGSAEALAGALVAALGGFGPLVLVGAVFLVSAGLTHAMGGTAAAAVVAPVAVLASQRLGVDPRSVAMAAVLGSSMAFPTPLGHPVNVLVMGPGGYGFRDYLRVGVPLAVLLFAATLALLPVFWPLGAVP